jgi:hypothetical protein
MKLREGSFPGQDGAGDECEADHPRESDGGGVLLESRELLRRTSRAVALVMRVIQPVSGTRSDWGDLKERRPKRLERQQQSERSIREPESKSGPPQNSEIPDVERRASTSERANETG